MIEFYEKMAERIVTGLNIKKNEHILVSGGIHQYELLSKIAVGIAVKGGLPKINISSDEHSYEMLTKVSDEYILKNITPHDKYMATLYDGAICINGTINEKIFSDVPKERLMLSNKSGLILNDLAKSSKRRSIFMAWPTKEKAESCNMTQFEFEKLYMDAFLTDIDSMWELGNNIKTKIKKGGNVHITSARGSDLSFVLDSERRYMIDTGLFTEDMVDEGDITKNLPCGEVYTTPLEKTVNGIAIFDLAFHDGKPIKNLKLEFENGKLVNYSSDSGIENFKKRYDAATGDKDKLGELGIGINPVMKKAIGHTLLDEKIFGSIHLALGENRMYGGINSSSLHWDLVMLKPSLKIDSENVITNGIF